MIFPEGHRSADRGAQATLGPVREGELAALSLDDVLREYILERKRSVVNEFLDAQRITHSRGLVPDDEPVRDADSFRRGLRSRT